MSDPSVQADPDDPRVQAALREYLEWVDRGETPDREEFILRFPGIAEQLRSLLAAEDQLRRLAGAEPAGQRPDNPTQSFALHVQDTIAPQAGARRSAESGLKQEFGRYRIVKTLGKGAMGTVFLAEDTHLQRQVALKTPHFEQEPTPELLERFYREARAAATLRHPNICPVYDVGQIEGMHYISMAFIDGHSLSAFVQSAKPQPERQVLIVVRKLAQALQDAHEHGIVHRDLKPANIMIDTRNEPIIMDFGLARQLQRDTNIRITQSGMLIGTPAYMSPEQIDGELDKIGPPTDQYSLGVILYELLTGQLPFRGSVAAVMGQIVTKETPPPSQLRPDLDPRIEAACLKMMAKSPVDRFPSVSAVAEELATILRNPAAKPKSEETAGPVATVAPAAQTSEQQPVPARPLILADRPPESKTPAPSVLQPPTKTSVSGKDLTSLEELARKCLARHDYDQVIQIVERVPEEQRNAGLQSLLARSREKADEIAFLICEIDEAVRFHDRETALKKADALLKIKPGHRRTLELREKLGGSGAAGAARSGPLRQFAQPWNEGGWIPWSVLAFGLAVFGVMTFVVTNYLRSPKSVANVQVDTPKAEEAANETKDFASVGPNKIQAKNSAPAKQSNLPRPTRRKAETRFQAKNEIATDAASPRLAAPFDAAVAKKAQQQWADQLKLPVELINSIGMKLILIPPGSFTMGSPANEVDRDKEETQVGVTLTEPYWLGEREVTQSEWQRVVHTTPWIGKEQTQVDDNFPANYLDWQQAMSFCQELTAADRRAGRLPSGFEYTLPTEAQWEYACRAGTTTRFSFGDDDSRLGDYAWFDQNSLSIGEGYPHEVAQKKPNPWGLYDMHGNSWEWCRDWFADRLPGGTDPVVSTGGANRVMRGGCVGRAAKDCRSASRGFDTPSNQFARLGFRVALCMASHDVAKTDDGARRDATQRTALAIRTQSVSALPIAPFDESAAKKAPQDGADRLKTPVAPSQPKAPPDGTKDSRPWYTVRVQVLQCCDDNGGRECAISIKEIRKMLDLANKIYAKARLRFVWSSAKDSAVLRNTLINSLMPGGSFSPKDQRAPGAGTIEQGHSECRKIAERYPGKMVVFFRWGDHIHNPAGSGYSGGNNSWVVMPSPRATNMGPRGFSHEVGHYFGLDHTFARGFSSVAEASEFLKNHGDDMSVFDGDRLSDTLPDPGLNIAFNNGVRKVTLNGKDVPIPTGNLMSYMNWDGHEWMSNQQAERARAFYRFRSRFGMVYPTNIGAPNPIEAESLPFETRGDFSAAAQRMAGFGFGWWSGDAQVWANGGLGGSLVLKFEVKEPGPKNVNVYMTFAPDNGKADISIDGKRVGQTFDGFAPLLSASGPISLGRVDLSQGAHTIEFTLVGKNEESKGTGLGVDCVSLVAVKP